MPPTGGAAGRHSYQHRAPDDCRPWRAGGRGARPYQDADGGGAQPGEGARPAHGPTAEARASADSLGHTVKWTKRSSSSRQGVETLDVLCPGFAVDCLETLEEVALRYRTVFLTNGGKQFRYISALNASTTHVTALANIATRQLAGRV
ncbi:MAG: ferrochelatase [Acetobacteraceae bacterium]